MTTLDDLFSTSPGFQANESNNPWRMAQVCLEEMTAANTWGNQNSKSWFVWLVDTQ